MQRIYQVIWLQVARAVSHFSLDRKTVFSRRTTSWKLLEKANREKSGILRLTNTKMLSYGIHVRFEGVSWIEEF